MSAVAPSPLPTWDLETYFPAPDSAKFEQQVRLVKSQVDQLESLLNEHANEIAQLTPETVEGFDRLINHFNELQQNVRTVSAYLGCLISADTRNEIALAKDSEFDSVRVRLSKLITRLTAWLGTLPVDGLVQKSTVAMEHEYMLQKASIAAQHLMSPDEEALAADLSPTGASAWGKLHSNMTSQIMVEVQGQPRTMSEVRNLAYDPDRKLRREAYEAELAAWKAVEVPMAACMNGVKGEVGVLSKRRGWESPLHGALFSANIDQRTLDAMLEAARAHFPDFRRYMKAKAKAIGAAKLAFYDIFAPVGSANRQWEWDEACEFVAKQFDAFSPKMGDFARRSYNESWIDVPPRPGKVDGAFCMPMGGDESRVLMNYKPAFGSVKTLAHELGHGYHNLCLADRTPWQRNTPMTLAETASIFCETVVKNAAMKEMSEEERFAILEGSLQGATQTVVDIFSRYLFESRVFEARTSRELAASEFNELMLNAQKETYGDGLDPEALHPYMWAVKPHYYSGRSFYNFPYMFGLLFGLGLYAQFDEDPEKFKASYDDLLSSTGLADAATLALRFGIDITTQEFWRGSLGVLKAEIDEFEHLVEARA